MWTIVKKSIYHHKANYFLCTIVLMLIYVLLQILINYYYNDTLSNQDEEVYRFCEVQFSKTLKYDEIQQLEQYCQRQIQGYRTTAYVWKDMQGMYTAAFSDDVLEELKKEETFVYGCSPFIVSEVVPKTKLQSVQMVVVECKSKWKTDDLKDLKKQLKQMDKSVEIHYATKGRWIWNCLSYYHDMVLIMFAVWLFALTTVILLVEYLLESQREEITVFLMCGADIHFVRKFYGMEQICMQLVALFMGSFVTIICVYVVNIIEVKQFYFFPYLCSLGILILSLATSFVVIEKMLKKDICVFRRKKV